MTGPEHFQHAEQLLDWAGNHEAGDPIERYQLAAAQVHATLALAAAIGTGMAAGAPSARDEAAWLVAAGTRRAGGGD